MPKARRWQWQQLRWFWLTALVVAVDQWSKAVITANLALYERITIVPLFNLTLAYNEGAAFSFLAGAGGWQRWLFASIACLTSALIAGWLLTKKESRWVQIALALILGGALGNLWDRLMLGHVVDFLDFYWASWHFPAFNIADTAITVGVACMLLDMFLTREASHE